MTAIKPIFITEKNAAAIDAALAAVNGRAEAFTISDWSIAAWVAEKADEALSALPKADRKGARASFIPAGPSAKAYKYDAKSTRIWIERRASGWFLTDVEPAKVGPKQGERLSVSITQDQADEIARRAVARFVVRATA